MPSSAIGPALGIGGSLLGALGSKPQVTNTSQNSTTNMNQNQTGSFDNTSTTNPLESAYFSQFRQGLVPAFRNAYADAQKPVIGQNQTTQFMEGLHGLAGSSIDSLKQTLAKSGALQSGRFGSGASSIYQNMLGQGANFLGQIPQINQAARTQNTNSLLGMGMNWAGRDPLGQTTSGSGNSNQNTTGTSQMNSTGQSSTPGPGFGGSLFNSLGGMFGAGSYGSGPLGNLGSLWKPSGGNFPVGMQAGG